MTRGKQAPPRKRIWGPELNNPNYAIIFLTHRAHSDNDGQARDIETLWTGILIRRFGR